MVSATMVESWESFVDELSPAFELEETDALKAAVPYTAVSEVRMLNALGAALKVAPPTSAVESTVTRTLAEGGALSLTR
jgi:hypothetical protein